MTRPTYKKIKQFILFNSLLRHIYVAISNSQQTTSHSPVTFKVVTFHLSLNATVTIKKRVVKKFVNSIRFARQSKHKKSNPIYNKSRNTIASAANVQIRQGKEQHTFMGS